MLLNTSHVEICSILCEQFVLCHPSADPKGGGGAGGPDPPGKAQVIWVSIGDKLLDPPGKSWTLPLKKVGLPLEP